MNDQPPSPPAANKEKLLPLAMVILALALLLQVAADTYHARQNRQSLQLAIANQESPLGETLKVRRQLNALAGKTVKLAQQGNASAAVIIKKMEAAGVKFSAANDRGQDE